MKPARRTLCVSCLPLAQALSIEVAAHPVVGHFLTTRERVMVSRSFIQPAQFGTRPQALGALQCPKWVNRVVLTVVPRLLIFPRKRTSSEVIGMSQTCQNRKSPVFLFDHLVGTLLKLQGYVEAERLRGLQIDHELELCRRLHWEFIRLRPLQNPIDIRSRAPEHIGCIGSVAHERAFHGILSQSKNRRESLALGRPDDHPAIDDGEGIWSDDQAVA
jgi:hypothetical protein